jgi:hypothetical protein
MSAGDAGNTRLSGSPDSDSSSRELLALLGVLAASGVALATVQRVRRE